MVPSYDFDIHWLSPREAEADPAIGQLLNDIGFNGTSHDKSPGKSRNIPRGKSRGNFIALFRDPQVIEMIERADPLLRAYLKASGFGFVASQSGAPDGTFPAADRVARTDVFARLDANLSEFDLKSVDLGGFDFEAFLKAIVEGRPVPVANEAEGSVRAKASPPPAPREVIAEPSGQLKLVTHYKIMPLMMLALAATLGISWLVQQLAEMQIGL